VERCRSLAFFDRPYGSTVWSLLGEEPTWLDGAKNDAVDPERHFAGRNYCSANAYSPSQTRRALIVGAPSQLPSLAAQEHRRNNTFAELRAIPQNWVSSHTLVKIEAAIHDVGWGVGVRAILYNVHVDPHRAGSST
jgi:hypothetical protein